MQLYSTNNPKLVVGVREAVLRGLAPDGGLFMPQALPPLPEEFIRSLPQFNITEIGQQVIGHLLKDDIPATDLNAIVAGSINFAAPLVQLNDNTSILELWHGPTLAFKDFGARFMARLMSYYVQNNDRELIVLVATSGDTGSAVANGFYNVPGIKVVILYPSGAVSHIQEQQLTTLGNNVTALEVEGDFDDCQRLVKQAFVDADLTTQLELHSVQLTSANSINIARLIPQMVYYFSAYGQYCAGTQNPLPVVVSVPSGNFGNLTAGVMAKKLGLPIHHFVAACNANDSVLKYLQSGKFQPQTTVHTMSNAMDVGNPSNFARLLELYQHDASAMAKDMSAYSVDDVATQAAMTELKQRYNYVMDPHGAVGYVGWQRYQQQHTEPSHGIVLETAHPAKFIEVETLPPALAACLTKPKQAMRIGAEFGDLKEYLI